MPPKRVRSEDDAPPPALAPAPAPAPALARARARPPLWALRGSHAEIGPIPLHGSPEAEILRPEKRRKTRAAARESARHAPAFAAGLDESGRFTDWWTTYGLESYPQSQQ